MNVEVLFKVARADAETNDLTEHTGADRHQVEPARHR